MPLPLAPIIAGGAALVGQGINAWIQSGQNKKQREFDKGMAEYAYSKDLEMFNKANEYNAPKQQMQRFEDAGLNKNLIYSQGQPGQAAVSMPKYQDVKGTYGNIKIDPKAVTDTYQNTALYQQQYDLLAKQIELTNNNALAAQFNALASEDQYNANKEVVTFWDDGSSTVKPSIWEHQYNAAENKSKQTLNELNKSAADAGISQQQLIWAQKKIQTMLDTNVNIDKDTIPYRQLAEILGPLLKYLTPKIRKFLTP